MRCRMHRLSLRHVVAVVVRQLVGIYDRISDSQARSPMTQRSPILRHPGSLYVNRMAPLIHAFRAYRPTSEYIRPLATADADALTTDDVYPTTAAGNATWKCGRLHLRKVRQIGRLTSDDLIGLSGVWSGRLIHTLSNATVGATLRPT